MRAAEAGKRRPEGKRAAEHTGVQNHDLLGPDGLCDGPCHILMAVCRRHDQNNIRAVNGFGGIGRHAGRHGSSQFDFSRQRQLFFLL